MQRAHSVVAPGNVAVKSKKIFLSVQERVPKVEKVQLEIIFQQPKIMSFKRGLYSEEIQLSDDVFTVLEHPYKKLASDADMTKKKESIYEAPFRAGLVMTITATIPESGLIPNFKFFSYFSFIRWLIFAFLELQCRVTQAVGHLDRAFPKTYNLGC